MAGSTGWPNDRYAELGEQAGRACFRLLLLEELWMHRRVEVIAVQSPQLIRRQVSVDFTVPSRLVPLLALNPRQSVVPLAILRKAVLRDFDLRDEDGRALAVLSRPQNALVGQGALVAAARHAGKREPSRALTAAFGRIAHDDPADARAEVEALAHGNREALAVLRDPYIRALLSDLTENYLLLAVVDDVERRRVLKFGLDVPLQLPHERGIAERLGWRGQRFGVALPLVGRTASFHAEIVIPEELKIERAVIFDAEAGTTLATDTPADRATLHVAGAARGTRARLDFRVRAERAGFPVLAFAVTLVSAVLLAAGALLADLRAAQAGPAVSVLLAASAFFAAAVARAEEHPLVRWLFALPRALVAATAVSGLAAGAALALRANETVLEAVWAVSAGVAALAAGALLVALVRARPLARPALRPVRLPDDVD